MDAGEATQRRSSEKAIPIGQADDKGRTTFRLDDALAFQLRRAQEASFKAFVQRIGETHIWPGWYALLTIIADNPNINQKALSRATDRDKSTLTASLRELEKAGLIQRRRDAKDGRSSGLSLTLEGKAHLAMLTKHAQAHDAHLDTIVGAENKELLIACLKRLADECSRDCE